MDIHNGLDGLKSLLGVTPAAPAVAGSKRSAGSGESVLSSDMATLSSAGSEVSQTAAGSDVRMEKVTAIQAALVAGTYSVPASAVASKVVDSMLSGGR
jgi:negative regulator of flagellin synthesis FlgM